MVLALAGCLGGMDVSAQVNGEPRTFSSLTRTVSQRASDGQVLELRVHWIVPSAAAQSAAAPAAGGFALVEQRLTAGFLRRERRPQLSPDVLVLVVRAADGRELDWRTTPNPRVLRAETPGPDGRLSGQFFELPDVDLFMAIPRLMDASAIRLYQPRWTGTEYALDSLGDVALATLP